jgi:nucleoside 2-deoxyribosyltransferase
MSDDWTQHDPERWSEYARHVLDEMVPMMRDSAVVCSLVPTGETDVKFAVELGMAIMLDKPIVLLVHSGTKVPARLARAADEIVEYTGPLGLTIAERLQEIVARLGGDT